MIEGRGDWGSRRRGWDVRWRVKWDLIGRDRIGLVGRQTEIQGFFAMGDQIGFGPSFPPARLLLRL